MSKRHLRLLFVHFCALFITTSSLANAAEPSGVFKGEIVAQWLKDGRRMKLREPFEFIDASKRPWRVPEGTIVDGASIPRPLWSVIGAPFSGKYRSASVIHDYYCDRRTRKWEEVHRVFYDAMLTAGVEEKTAWLMYQAVHLPSGPSIWTTMGGTAHEP